MQNHYGPKVQKFKHSKSKLVGKKYNSNYIHEILPYEVFKRIAR